MAMNKHQQLELLHINRQQLQQNNAYGFEFLQEMNQSLADQTDEEVQLSLQFNNSLMQFYFHSNYQKAIEISLAALNKYPHSIYHANTAQHNSFIGVCYTFLAEYNAAEEYLNKALHLAETVQEEKPFLVTTILQSLFENNLYRKGNPEQAVAYLNRALHILEQHPDPIRTSGCLMQLGTFYFEQQNFDTALDYFGKAATGYEENYDLQNMAILYCNTGRCYYHQHQLDEAEKNLLKALNLCFKAATPDNTGLCNYHLGQLYQAKKDWQTAHRYTQTSTAIFETTGNQIELRTTEKLLKEIEEQLQNSKQ